MNSEHKPIVVVGSINMDLVARTQHIPVSGQTITATGFETTPGGKGANQAVAAARLGYPVEMIGMVGDDVFGQALLDNLAGAGVGIAAVTRVAGPSGIALITVAENGENSIVVVPGANGKADCAAINLQKDLIRSAGMVLCQLELPLDTVCHLLSFCSDLGVPVCLDPAPAAPLPNEMWKQIAWFTPNQSEAEFYLGNASKPEDLTRHLLARGTQGVVLKRGADGAFLASASCESAWIRPFRVETVDTVAAGDCFNAAFAVALMEGNDPAMAARFANAAAAIAVTRKGAQASMPSRAEVEAFLARQKETTKESTKIDHSVQCYRSQIDKE